MHLKILIRENLFHMNLENWDRNTQSNSPRAPGTKLKIGERKGPSRGIIQKYALHERSLCAPKFVERSHEENLRRVAMLQNPRQPVPVIDTEIFPKSISWTCANCADSETEQRRRHTKHFQVSLFFKQKKLAGSDVC